jgi:hypothetical protein
VEAFWSHKYLRENGMKPQYFQINNTLSRSLALLRGVDVVPEGRSSMEGGLLPSFLLKGVNVVPEVYSLFLIPHRVYT